MRREKTKVVSFAGLICSLVLPGNLSCETSYDSQAADERSALMSLKTINAACITYDATYEHGFPQQLARLGGDPSLTNQDIRNGKYGDEKHAGLVDDILASGKKSGYVFRYEIGPADRHRAFKTYKVWARPQEYGETGKRSFFTDQSGLISYNVQDRDATANDPFVNEGDQK